MFVKYTSWTHSGYQCITSTDSIRNIYIDITSHPTQLHHLTKYVIRKFIYHQPLKISKYTKLTYNVAEENNGVPVNLPRACKHFALRKIASKSKLTEWIDIVGNALVNEWRRGSSFLLMMDDFIFGTTAVISIPSNTCRAPSMFPFWNSSLPNRALAS